MVSFRYSGFFPPCKTIEGHHPRLRLRFYKFSVHGKGRLLVSLVPMLEQNKKTMRKGTYFKLGSAQRYHRLGSEIWYFRRKRVGLHRFDTNAVIMDQIQTGDHC